MGNYQLIYFSRDTYKRFDDKYIKPWLLRENNFKDPKIIETYENLTERDALEFLKRNPTQFEELAGSKTIVDVNELAKDPSTNKTKEQDSKTNSHVEDSSFSHANRDPKEVHYNQSQRDMDETESHHTLSENLFQARNQPSKLSYSHNAIDEDDPKLAGETNTAFVGDAQHVDEEAIQSKTLPWRREDEQDIQEQQ